MPGERREILEVQRDRLVRIIEEGVEPRDLASLSRELRLVLAELDALGGGEGEGSVVDELRERRAARLAGPEAEAGSST